MNGRRWVEAVGGRLDRLVAKFPDGVPEHAILVPEAKLHSDRNSIMAGAGIRSRTRSSDLWPGNGPRVGPPSRSYRLLSLGEGREADPAEEYNVVDDGERHSHVLIEGLSP